MTYITANNLPRAEIVVTYLFVVQTISYTYTSYIGHVFCNGRPFDTPVRCVYFQHMHSTTESAHVLAINIVGCLFFFRQLTASFVEHIELGWGKDTVLYKTNYLDLNLHPFAYYSHCQRHSTIVPHRPYFAILSKSKGKIQPSTMIQNFICFSTTHT